MNQQPNTTNAPESPGAIRREVWRLGIPAILESLFTTFSSIINTKMVAGMGIAAISAVSVTNQPRLFIFCLFFAVNTTVSALIARYYGKKDQRKANELFVSAFQMTLALCIVMSILSVLFAEKIMLLCSGQHDTMAASTSYFRIIMGGCLFQVLYMLINSALRGCGYTKITMISNTLACLVNILLNWLLIKGHCGCPALGINGAAIATVSSGVAALIISGIFFMQERFYVNLKYCIRERIRPAGEALHEIFRLWKNICTENMLTRVGFLISSMITARIGSFDMSVYSVGMTLMNISFAFGDGLQSASVALIGRSMGEDRQDRLDNYTRAIQRSGLQCSIALGLLYAFLGHWYYQFFSADPEFIYKGMVVCVIIALIGPFQVAQLIYNGVLKSMDCSKFTLIAAILSVTIINPIFGFLFAILMGFGIWGVFGSMFISQVARFGMLHFMYRKNRGRFREAGSNDDTVSVATPLQNKIIAAANAGMTANRAQADARALFYRAMKKVERK